MARQAPGSGIALARFGTEARLVEALRDLDAADRSSASALICRTPEAAALFARSYSASVRRRGWRWSRFVFEPGVSVTCVPQSKGLEFDHVVVPDAARAQYADTAEARRALYVAATRASAQLVLAATGEPSPLLAP